MARKPRTIVLAALAASVLAACCTPAEAQILWKLRPRVHVAPAPVIVSPPVVAHYEPIPYLGFESFFDGTGEQVTAVQYGSPAWRIGLEPGDTVVAVNGVAISYRGHGLQLVGAARYQGYLTLTIRDCHTGLLTSRTISLAPSSLTAGSLAVGSMSLSSGYAVQRRPSTILRRLPY